MSSFLKTFPVDSTALTSGDASIHLLCVNTLMKNVLIRALLRIIELSPSMNGNNVKFGDFIGYVDNFCDMLQLHLEGDEMFFTTPNAQGVRLVEVLGEACNPRSTKELDAALDVLRKSADQWKMTSSSFESQQADTLSELAKVMTETMTTQRFVVQNDKLKSVGDEALLKMIQENIAWLGSKSDVTILLPFILSHHDSETALEWPMMTEDGKKELHHLVEAHAEWWQFAPFDPITRERKVNAV